MSLIRWQAGFDVHGNMQDSAANKVFFEFAKIWKPTIRICGGDLWNFAPLRKGADEDERRQSLREDLEAGKRWFNQFKPTHFLRGNHDERLWLLAAKGTGPIADYAQDGIEEIEAMVKAYKCTMLPYDKRLGILQLGDLRFLHGFHSGIYAARQTALIYGNSIFGHVHAIDQHAAPGLERRVARAVGALCLLSMDYNSRQPNTLRQANGFCYGFVNSRSGEYHVYQAEGIGGKWILPSEFTTL